jgi:hypothetical protein
MFAMSTLPPHQELHLAQLSQIADAQAPRQLLQREAARHDTVKTFIMAHLDVPGDDGLATAASNAVGSLLEGKYVHPAKQDEISRAFRRGAGMVAFVLKHTAPTRSLVNELAEFGRSTVLATADTNGRGMEQFTFLGYQHAVAYDHVMREWGDDLLRAPTDWDPLTRGVGFMLGVVNGVRQLRIEQISATEHEETYWHHPGMEG